MKSSLGTLKVFIATGCRGCGKALELVAWIREIMPRLIVEVIDLSIDTSLDSLVFAVPTYMYNSRPVFLGNPSRTELQAWLSKIEQES